MGVRETAQRYRLTTKSQKSVQVLEFMDISKIKMILHMIKLCKNNFELCLDLVYKVRSS